MSSRVRLFARDPVSGIEMQPQLQQGNKSFVSLITFCSQQGVGSSHPARKSRRKTLVENINRKMKSRLILILTFISFRCLSQSDTPIINILDAIDKKVIEYNSTGRWNQEDKSEYIDADGQYFGKCMLIILHNISDDTVYIFIPEGLILVSGDTIVQNMLITKPIYTLLNPKQAKKISLYAMCSELHDRVPATFVKYRVGKMGDSNLVSIAKVINESFMQNVVGQDAVWAYTDNASVEDLSQYGATNESLNLTLLLLEKAKVETKLAKELNFVSDKEIKSNRDSVISKLTNEFKASQHQLASQSGKFILNPYIIYSGIATIVLLVGATVTLAFRRTKNKDKLS